MPNLSSLLRRRREADESRSVIGYFVVMIVAWNLAGWGTPLAGPSISFFLKDDLKLGPVQSSQLDLIVGLPIYFSVFFGFLRDRWSPFGLGDRGYILLFAPLSAGLLVWFGLGDLTLERLRAAAMMTLCTDRFASTALFAAMVVASQRHGVTGRMNAATTLAANVLAIGTAAAGGWVAAHVRFQHVMLGLAASTLGFALLGLWNPKGVYDGPPPERPPKRGGLHEIRLLLRHRPFLPVLGISLALCFNWIGTPFFYYFTDRMGATREQVGLNGSIGTAAFIAGVAYYGIVCRKVNLRRYMVGLAAFAAVFQWGPLLLAPNAAWVIAVNASSSLTGGLWAGAFGDVVMRVYPRGLEGVAAGFIATLATLLAALLAPAGAWLYERYGLWPVIVVFGLMCAALIPCILSIPPETMAAPDAPITEEEIEEEPART